mgnify:CR=1 FL=1
MRYDIAIVGTGPAGLSAAVTAKLRNKNVILFGSSNLSEKVEKAHEIKNYLGIPSVKGEDLANSFKRHLEDMELSITQEIITMVYDMGEYFNLLSKTNEMYEASTVIIASGTNFGKPYKGEKEFLGRGVSYCATCDAPLYKGKDVVVIGTSVEDEEEALYMSEICNKVCYIPLYSERVKLNDKIDVIYDIPVEFVGGFKADKLIMKNGELEADGFFILRQSIAPDTLVPGIKLDGNNIEVDRKMATNLNGCFACGDVVGAPYQYIKAAGEGNVAALSAVSYLNRKH